MEFRELDVSLYSRIPNLDIPSMIAFGDRLQALAPPRPTGGIKQTLAELNGALRELKGGFDAARSAEPSLDKRPIDQGSDLAWWCIDVRLESAAALPAAVYARAGRASELRGKLFPDGRRFLNIDYAAQWAEMDSRMRLIEREKLRPELEELCGAPFVAYLFKTHEQYRVMIGAKPGGASAAPTLPALVVLQQKLRRALVTYLMQLAAAYHVAAPKLKAALLPSFDLCDEVREKTLAATAAPRPAEPPPPAPGPAPTPTPTPA